MTLAPDILTIDVEEWFHGHNYLDEVPPAAWTVQESRVEANTDRLLALLDRHAVRATFFVLGWTAERHPDLVRRIAAAGHEIGCHSYGHPIVHALGPAEFRQDLDRALAALAACGVQPRGYRAPSFTLTPPVHGYLEILRDRGFAYDCSLFPVKHPRYGQPRSPRLPFILAPTAERDASPPFVVVPMPTWRVFGINLPFSGGGYLRLLPAWTFRLIQAGARRQGQPTNERQRITIGSACSVVPKRDATAARRSWGVNSVAYPSRVLPGMRAAGHMGSEHVTVQNLSVVRVQEQENLLLVRGAVPGANGKYVVIKKA